MTMKSWWIKKIAMILAAGVAAVAFFGFATMLLWNALIPELFGGPAVTFWQAVGLMVLAHILVRGWSPWRHGHGWKHDRWKHKFEEKLAAMTPEEREKLREEYRRRCGWTPGDDVHKEHEGH
jgi:hypothetical protein